MRTLIFAAALVLGNIVQAAIAQSGLVACYPFDGNPDDIQGGHDAAPHFHTLGGEP